MWYESWTNVVWQKRRIFSDMHVYFICFAFVSHRHSSYQTYFNFSLSFATGFWFFLSHFSASVWWGAEKHWLWLDCYTCLSTVKMHTNQLMCSLVLGLFHYIICSSLVGACERAATVVNSQLMFAAALSNGDLRGCDSDGLKPRYCSYWWPKRNDKDSDQLIISLHIIKFRRFILFIYFFICNFLNLRNTVKSCKPIGTPKPFFFF